MRDLKTFLKDITIQPPVLFPTVAFVHVLWLLWTIWSVIQQPGLSTEINVLWMLAYTTFWIATADMRKWGAIGYVLVTTIDIILYFTVHTKGVMLDYGSPIFILDILFCFFIMFYFKRFR